MNAVIWWLEAPWQIRASVFFLSFLACFVAPWLYNSGISATPPSRRTVAGPKTEAKSAPERPRCRSSRSRRLNRGAGSGGPPRS